MTRSLEDVLEISPRILIKPFERVWFPAKRLSKLSKKVCQIFPSRLSKFSKKSWRNCFKMSFKSLPKLCYSLLKVCSISPWRSSILSLKKKTVLISSWSLSYFPIKSNKCLQEIKQIAPKVLKKTVWLFH